MEKPKLSPFVTITTYSESSFARKNFPKHQKELQNENNNEDTIRSNQIEATKAEFSTNFFGRLQPQTRANLTSSTGTLCSSMQTNRIRGKQQLDLSQIKGPTGSIRGHKDVVRKSLEGIRVAYNRRLSMLSGAQLSSFLSNQQHQLNYSLSKQLQDFSILSQSAFLGETAWSKGHNLDEIYSSEYLERLQEEEQDQCVAYTTSLGVIRRTFEDCKILKSILNLNLIKYEERDIFLNQEFKHQLRLRLSSISVPAIFVEGKFIGGLAELEQMNENGNLSKTLAKFKMLSPPKGVCLCCGDAKFIACQSCNGSRKSTVHHFKFNSVALRCIKCDKNEGLVQCPVCSNGDNKCSFDQDPSELNANEKHAKDVNNFVANHQQHKILFDENCNEISNC